MQCGSLHWTLSSLHDTLSKKQVHADISKSFFNLMSMTSLTFDFACFRFISLIEVSNLLIFPIIALVEIRGSRELTEPPVDVKSLQIRTTLS